ncbi:HTH domain-containing protein [Irregularibacter muris]|uniref:HTH domain-containing protein n=1 Tax=Irregularibacter muris TaxID=1796619 RepID=A0AAE3HFU4_9FIRM|nr:HTH domain-containing protein [Irregularibacter muris]MCR1899826.1 HTH domain-containing protein [Irregularibacter muris]
MNIGIIGPPDSGQKIAEIMEKNFPQLTPRIYDVSKIEEAYLKVRYAEGECQGLIFTGVGVYSKIIAKLDPSLPYVYIPFLASSIMKSLWALKEKFPDCKSFSIDTVEASEVEDALEELHLKDMEIHSMEYHPLYPEQKYVDFHINMQESKKVDVSIIGLGWVYEEMHKRGYPIVRLYSTKSSIKNTISDLCYKIKAVEVKESTIAVQLLNIRSQQDMSQYKILETNSILQNSLVGYLKEVQGSIFSQQWNQYIIFSNRGAIENIQNLDILKKTLDYLEKKNIIVHVGIGLGRTAHESEINARKALEIALKEEESCIFKIDGKKVEGPLLLERELSYDFVMDPSEIEEMAKLIDLNPLYIKKIQALKKKHAKDTFTSEELGKHLNVSTRTANRIIKKIIDNDCGEVVGLETNNPVGRPKQIIKIDFGLH